MKPIQKLFALCLVLALCVSMIPAVFAADSLTATIDTDRKASLDLYKYDFTGANADGILEWNSYVSTGKKDKAVEYTASEIQIDNCYTLLKDAIKVVTSVHENGVLCDICGKSALTATATVNGDRVTMMEDNGSLSAILPLTVINTKNFDLPQTGDNGVWMYGVIGAGFLLGAALLIFFATRKKKSVTE